MKKYLLIVSFMIAGMTLMGQRSAIIGATGGSDQTKGVASTNITLPVKLYQEYDYSYQVIPALYGAGDSVNATLTLYQSNALSGGWSEITSARDTITSTAGCLIEGTDATGLQHRITITGVPADTITYTVYYILKLDKQFE
jgi:hypothetical protein